MDISPNIPNYLNVLQIGQFDRAAATGPETKLKVCMEILYCPNSAMCQNFNSINLVFMTKVVDKKVVKHWPYGRHGCPNELETSLKPCLANLLPRLCLHQSSNSIHLLLVFMILWTEWVPQNFQKCTSSGTLYS